MEGHKKASLMIVEVFPVKPLKYLDLYRHGCSGNDD